MIRINLLPVKGTRRRATGQRHLFVIAVMLGIECLGFFYAYNTKAEELEGRKQVNSEKKKKIDQLKAEVGDIEKLQLEKSSLEQQQQVLDALEVGRAGPVNVLAELSFLMTIPSDARARLEVERRGGQPNWDSKRVWLRAFNEADNNVTIIGEAKSNDDVAEFLTRMQSSDYFKDVKLLWTKQREVAELNNLRFVRFNVRARVSYTGDAVVPQLPTAKGKKKGGH